MECQQVQESLPFYTQTERPAFDTEEAERHLAHCSDCQAKQAEIEHLSSLLRNFVASAPVANARPVGQVLQPRTILSRPRPARVLASILLAVGLLLGLAATAVAVYYKVVVVEPSRQISGLQEAIRKADFPVWVSDTGELTRVSDIAGGKDYYTTILEYRLTDGRRFYVMEEKVRPRVRPSSDDDSGILDENVDINGQKGVLYLGRRTTIINGEYRYGWHGPNLDWQADGTQLRIEAGIDAVFTREEVIAIARGLRTVQR